MAVIPYLAFTLIVLGAKNWLISIYASPIPFWDQWDAEADGLYRPWLEGTLGWGDLFKPHNEHRILLTRLLGILLLELNGRVWDPVMQMQVNACVHVVALCALIYFIGGGLSEKNKSVLILFCTVIFTIPYGWENTLAGFQSQFYFSLVLTFIFLWSMSKYKTYTGLWWAGLACGLLSVFSIASGALTLLAGIVLVVLRPLITKNRKQLPLMGALIMLIAACVAIFFTPVIAGHAPLKAQSIGQFFAALTSAMSWPGPSFLWILMQLPILIFAAQVMIEKNDENPNHWFVLALAVWVFGQYISIAYGRATGTLASRYLDLFAISLLINFYCTVNLVRKNKINCSKLHILLATLWMMVLAVGLSQHVETIANDIQSKRQQGITQQNNVKEYLKSHDVTHLTNKPQMDLPYPNPQRLKILLDHPVIVRILPRDINGLEPKNRLSIVKHITNLISNSAVYLVGIGVALLILSLIFNEQKKYQGIEN